MGENSINILVLAKDMASSVLKGVADNVTSLAKGFQDKLVEGVHQANTAILGLGATLGGIFLKSVMAASDAQETYSKFATVFKDVNDKAQASIEELAKAYGLSSKNARQLVGDTGDLLTGFGFSGKKALDLSLQVNRLAVDLASFTNAQGGAEAVSNALTKALLGEREALKTYGIAIMEADIDAELLRKGMSKLTGEALRQAKAQITLELALRQSKNAIGDFARTSDGFANRIRVAQGNIEDFLISLGGINQDGTLKPGGPLDLATQFLDNISKAFDENKQAILDWVQNGINIIRENIEKAIQVGGGFLEWLKDTAKQFGVTRGTVDKFITVAKTLLPIVLGVGAAFAVLTNPLVIFVGTIALLSAGIALLWDNFERIKATLLSLSAVQSVVNFFSVLFQQIRDFMADPTVQAFFAVIWASLTNILGQLLGFIEPIISAIGGLWESIKPLVELLAGILIPILAVALVVALKGIEYGLLLVRAAFELFVGGIRGAVAILSGIFQGIIIITKAWWETIIDFFTNGGARIGQIWAGVGDSLKKVFDGVWASIMQTGKGVLNGFIDLINQAIKSINGLIDGANKIPGVKIDHINNIPKFAQGGIVGGRSFNGDNMLIRANSGEEVVTQNDRQTIKEFIAELAGQQNSGKIVNNFYGYDASQISTAINQQLKLGY